MSLTYRLASRNLLHDRLRFIATVVGIVFSIVLVTVQLGLYLGFGRIVTTMIDHASADLWIMPPGTKCFEDPSTLDERTRFQALSINGVAQVAPVVIGYADWRIPAGGTFPVSIVGSDLRKGGLPPWNLVEGSVDELAIPGAVAVDRSYFDRLGISRIGANAEIRGQKVEVRAVTQGIRSFTTTPFVFTTLDRGRALTGIAANKANYFLVRVAPRADVESVRRRLQANLSDVDVLTTAQFRDRSRSFWLFGTGAGFALFAGALLGLIVGTVIVAQTIFEHQGSSQRVRDATRHRLVVPLYSQGHRLPGADQCGRRILSRCRDRLDRRRCHRGYGVADCHDARAHAGVVPADARHVRRIGDCRDRAGDAH
jgi:putative ABC transport system permease protein